jgi:hypothetical protein
MATKLLPVGTDKLAYTFSIELDKTIYQFTFTWNARESRWFMEIADEQLNSLVAGIAIVTGWPLLKRFQDSRLPPGLLYALDTQDTGTEPDDTDFGTRVLMVYEEVATQ